MPCGFIGTHSVKCKQLNSHTSLTTLCSQFLLSYGNQAMTKSAHWWSWSCDLQTFVIWREFFSSENTPEGHTETHKSFFFRYRQLSGRNSDHEWLRMPNISYYVIYYEKFRKVMQRTEKEALITNVELSSKLSQLEIRHARWDHWCFDHHIFSEKG